MIVQRYFSRILIISPPFTSNQLVILLITSICWLVLELSLHWHRWAIIFFFVYILKMIFKLNSSVLIWMDCILLMALLAMGILFVPSSKGKYLSSLLPIVDDKIFLLIPFGLKTFFRLVYLLIRVLNPSLSARIVTGFFVSLVWKPDK